MNALLVSQFLGWLLLGLGVLQAVPIVVALIFGEPTLPYVTSAAAAIVVGGSVVATAKPESRVMRARDGFLAVGLGWIFASIAGALPYVSSGALTPVDAFFEAVSGFTTTGSSAIADVEAIPRALLLWRAMTQWLGGMGIIVFAIALMPLLGVGGMQLFRAEMSGPVANKITPRVAETARRLWLVYVGFTVLQVALLVGAGLSFYDAVCHAMTTLATGGFSTRNASVGGFDSALVEWIVIVFMLLGGINFVLHYQLLTGRVRSVLRDAELRYFLALVIASTAVIWLSIGASGGGLRAATFQLVTIITTTGFATADFERWPSLAQLVLVQAMVMGAMAGSTSGGLKSLRTLIGLRALASVFVRQIHPNAVSQPARYAGRRVPDDVLAGIWAFFTAYALIALAATGVVASAGYDLVTSFTASLTALGNVGPGLGEVGPYDNFGHMPDYVKLTLSGAMLAGRLEIFTVLILVHPVFWRR